MNGVGPQRKTPQYRDFHYRGWSRHRGPGARALVPHPARHRRPPVEPARSADRRLPAHWHVRLPRSIAALLAIAAVGFFVYLIGNILLAQGGAVAEAWPRYGERLKS